MFCKIEIVCSRADNDVLLSAMTMGKFCRNERDSFNQQATTIEATFQFDFHVEFSHWRGGRRSQMSDSFSLHWFMIDLEEVFNCVVARQLDLILGLAAQKMELALLKTEKRSLRPQCNLK